MAKNKEKTKLKNLENMEGASLETREDVTEDTLQDKTEQVTGQDESEINFDEELKQIRLELDEYKNLYLRKAAEFENFKKRKQQEFHALIKSAGEALISDILPVLDDFDRFLASDPDNNEGLLEGARLIREKLWEPLEARGLEPIESVGNPFDPEIHEALLQQEKEGTEPGLVLEEHLCGYRLGDKVIRPAKVVVSA